jgi:predicted RNase H-like HicB family nuclease
MQRCRGGVSMKFYTFEIVIEKEPEDKGYLAYSPTLPGCFSNGKTIEEARHNIREAIQQHIGVLLEHSEPIPQNENLVHVEELSVGVPA